MTSTAGPANASRARLEAAFWAEPGPHGDVVHMVINGLNVGDPLTDRGWSATGYRWHDALHLAHAACLGWSPVLRNLAGVRRRSDPDTNHIEDGGRAVVADEAIAWATFCYARTRNWLATGEPIDPLLDRIEEMTFGLEVSTHDRATWTHAIRTGLSCLRSLTTANGGTLIGDLATGTLRYQELDPTTALDGSAR